MGKSTRRLGRGLDSLVSDLSIQTGSSKTPGVEIEPDRSKLQPSESSRSPRAAMLQIAKIHQNPFQPRSIIAQEELLSLSESIRQSGMIQPISVRQVGDAYEIIAGERRMLAAKAIGMDSIPALIREANDEQMLELALIENIQREDLNAIDRAKGYRRFCAAFGLKADEVARRVGEDRSTVANYLRLLDLPEAIQGRVADGTLSMGHARCLLGVPEEERQIRLAESVVVNQLSVRALEEIVRRQRSREQAEDEVPDARLKQRSAHLLDLQRRFEEAVKTKVTIHEGKKKGTGRIIMEYYSLDDFDRIATLLNVTVD